MKKTFKIKIKYAILFLVGGLVYMGIELLWRGYTNVTSFFMGGAAFIFIGILNEGHSWDTPLYQQMTISGVFITAMEFIVGSIFNRDYHIWDYRNMWLNINGQICLVFFLIWCVLSIVGILLDDYIRWLWFKEEKPRYKII